MPRHYRVRTSPVASLFGGIVGLLFLYIGFTMAIPNAGAFGVLWTGIAAVITVLNFYNALSRRGIANEQIEVSDDEQPATSDLATRLVKLDDLRAKSLITAAEYEQQRREIIKSL